MSDGLRAPGAYTLNVSGRFEYTALLRSNRTRPPPVGPNEAVLSMAGSVALGPRRCPVHAYGLIEALSVTGW